MAAAALLCSAGVASAIAQDGPTMFLAPKFPAGARPAATAMADFDGDGRLDVAVSCEFDDSIALLRGRGDGTFDSPVPIPVGDGPSGLVTADFDGDGFSDLAVANQGSDDVHVLLGRGSGSFDPPIIVPVGDGPRPLAVGLVDGDGILDLVVGDLADTTTVLLGVGDGGFVPGVPAVTGRDPSSVTVADLNLDGLADLVVTNETDDDFAVLLGLGGAAFAAPVTYSTANGPSGSVVADFNSDGLPDVAISCGLSIAVSAGLQFRFGLGDGAFGPATSFPAPPCLGVLATDTDADGDSDVLIAADAGFVYTLRNDGAGDFTQSASTPAGSSPRGISFGDLDGDGLDDVVAASTLSDDLVALRGIGGGVFEKSPYVPSGGTGPNGRALADVDADGRLDVIVAHHYSSSVSVHRGLGDGTFAPPLASPTGPNPGAIALGDIDDDGILDLAVQSAQDEVKIRQGVGDGTFVAKQSVAAAGVTYCRLADLDGDTDLDLVTVSTFSDVIRCFKNSGSGQFSFLVTKAVGDYPLGFDVGDLNGDGHVDLVTPSPPTHSLSLVMGLGSGTFANAVSMPTAFSPDGVIVVDLDEDGALDLVVESNGLQVHWGAGDGSFSPTPVPFNGGESAWPFTLADMDGDGARDLVTSSQSGQHVSIHRGLGDGVFGAASRFVVHRYSTVIGAADLDGDQALDLVAVGDVNDGKVTVLLNRASLPWVDLQQSLAGAGGAPHLAGTGTLAGGTPFGVTLGQAAPAAISAMIAGLSPINVPFKSGVLVPSLDVVLLIPTDGAGGYALSGTWPNNLPSGLEIYLQAWIVDPTGPAGFTASNALLATTPAR